MAPHQSFCLFVIAALYGACQAHCVFRTLMPMPMTMMDSSMMDEPQPSCTADDLSALLMLARALEMDRAACANNGIDVNGLLNTLVHALVFTATQNHGKGYDHSASFGGYPSGHPQTTYPSGSGSMSSSSGKTTSGSGNVPASTGQSTTATSGGNSGKKDPLIDLGLLGSDGKSNVANVGIAGRDILGLGLGGEDKGSRTSGNNGGAVSGLLGDVTGTVGNLVNGIL